MAVTHLEAQAVMRLLGHLDRTAPGDPNATLALVLFLHEAACNTIGLHIPVDEVALLARLN